MNERTSAPRRFQTPDGRSLDVYLGGADAGELIVFYNGTPSAGMIDPSLDRAAADRGLRVVSWTRPGYGSSTRQPGRRVVDVVPDTVAVMDQLGVREAHAAGWSGGGAHALAVAAKLPERIRGAATIAGAAPYPAEGLDFTAGMGKENVEGFELAMQGAEALRPTMQGDWEKFSGVTGEQVAAALGDLIDEVDRGSLTGEFAEFAAASFREALREGWEGWFDENMADVEPWGFDLSTIRVPVHVWQGRHDRMVPFAHGEWLASHIPSACPHLSDEHGHLTLMEDSIGEILDELISVS